MKELLLTIPLIAIIVLSGCIGQIPTEVRYKNDIITIEEYSVDTLNPYAGSPVTISFSIKNNGDKSVQWVEVNFFDMPNFEVISLECEGVTVEGNKCTFEGNSKLEIFDVRKISLTLQTPDVTVSSKKFTLSYSINYKYSGSREAHIPIIDGTTRKTPLSKFTQSEPTYGPVQVGFEPPVGRETKVDDRVIKEHFGIIGRPFKLELSFKHVGSSSIGKIQKVAIPKDQIKIDFKNTLEIAKNIESGIELPCNFDTEGELVVPDKLFCNLESKQKEPTVPEITGVISVAYSYDYQYIRTETLTVQPIPEE